MARLADVGIIGLGVMGLSAAVALTRKGLSVAGFDAHAPGHQLGSSHGRTRAIRKAYAEHPDYVPLLERAYASWRELEEETGQSLLTITGGLYGGPTECELVQGSLKAAQQHQLAHELLDSAECRKRFPEVALPDGFSALYEPSGGVVFVERSMEAMAEIVRNAGSELHYKRPVTSFDPSGSGFRLQTSAGEVEVARLIITAGPWSDKVLPAMKLPLRVTRQTVSWIDPIRREKFLGDRFPMIAMELDGRFYYSLPIVERDGYLKVACHELGPNFPLSSSARYPTQEDELVIVPYIEKILPGADGPHESTSVCLYTNTPDGHFIIDRHPEFQSMAFAAGFSGHGFKFAPAIGEILADLVTTGSSDHEIEFLSRSRFAFPSSYGST